MYRTTVFAAVAALALAATAVGSGFAAFGCSVAVPAAAGFSPLASAEVGIPASTEFQSRSMVWLPISPIWPAPKSQYMFQERQFMPGPPAK